MHGTNGDQINAQLPWNVFADGSASGTASVVVTSGGISSAPASVAVGPFSPGIFTLQGGAGQGGVVNVDGSLAAPQGALVGLNARPAAVGSTVMILATGLGLSMHPSTTGRTLSISPATPRRCLRC